MRTTNEMASLSVPSPAHRSDSGRAQEDVGIGMPTVKDIITAARGGNTSPTTFMHAGPVRCWKRSWQSNKGSCSMRCSIEYGRLSTELFKQMGADVLPIDHLVVVDGGKV
jgi:hypothetical protein